MLGNARTELLVHAAQNRSTQEPRAGGTAVMIAAATPVCHRPVRQWTMRAPPFEHVPRARNPSTAGCTFGRRYLESAFLVLYAKIGALAEGAARQDPLPSDELEFQKRRSWRRIRIAARLVHAVGLFGHIVRAYRHVGEPALAVFGWAYWVWTDCFAPQETARGAMA